MKYLVSVVSILFFSNLTLACEFLDKNSIDSANMLMGKKSQFYDAYKQGKCVLEEALKPLSKEQREIIAKMILKSYQSDNKVDIYSF